MTIPINSPLLQRDIHLGFAGRIETQSRLNNARLARNVPGTQSKRRIKE